MCDRFFSEYTIYYSGLQPDLTLKHSKLMELFQETSIMHTDSTTYPMTWYKENNFGFLLTNWQVKVNCYPVIYDRIKITTWASNFRGILAERSFEATNEENRVIAMANSKWVFTDLEKRRPTKVPPEIITGYGKNFEPPMKTDYTFPPTDEYEKVSENIFTVTRRDLDSNNHVNNVKYIEWMLDYIPGSTYDTLNITNMKALYKKECLCGSNVLVETYLRGNNEYITLIKPVEDPQALYASIYSLWV